MRTVELAKVAAAAEALRLRRIARRQGLRAAFGAGAGVFAIAALIVLHVVGYHALQPMLTPLQASAVVLAVDVVVAAILAFMAMRNVPDPVELEARTIREQAILEMKQSLTMMGMVANVTGMAVRTGAREGIRRGLVTGLTDAAMRLFRRHT